MSSAGTGGPAAEQDLRRAPVRVRAPGKINLFLAVGGPAPDGYHPLATVFQAVSLEEEVTAHAAEGFSLSLVGAVDPAVPTDDRNLALRAAHLLAAATGHPGGVHLEVRKSVPVAGGMGGGSADAAAALVACNELWGTGADDATLHDLAARLGADVPFALHGGTALGTGRGDVLTPVLARGRFDWVLVTSDDGLSTPEVYRLLDRLRAAEAGLADDPVESLEVPPLLLQALGAGDPHALALLIRNDLQAPALYARPELEQVLVGAFARGALNGLVSGSGPTLALLCASPESAESVRAALTAAGHRALHVHGPVAGARIVDAG